MKYLIAPLLLVTSHSHLTFAETCFSLTKTTQISSPGAGSMAQMMKAIPPNQITPAMKQLMDQQKKLVEPKKIQTYMNARYQVETTASTVDIIDYGQLTMTSIDLVQKTYRVTDLREFFAKMGDTLQKIKVPKPKIQATGQSKTIAGIKCQEFSMTMSADPSALGGPDTPAPLPKGMRFESEVLRCVSAQEPATYHTLRRGHADQVMKVMPADLRERLKELGSPADRSMFGGFEMPAADGLELEMRQVSKMKNAATGKAAPDPMMMAMMNSGTGGLSVKVDSVGSSCPPPSALTIPAGFKKQEGSKMPSPNPRRGGALVVPSAGDQTKGA